MSAPQVPLAQYGTAATGSSSGPALYASKLPKSVQQDIEIQQLTDLYQQQLAELNACHSLLTVDQERLAKLLAPYVDSRGELVTKTPDPDVLLFKQGLDLRLQEFEEDCKRIQNTERRLQQKIDEATTGYEHAVRGIAMSTDNRVFKRLREQQRLIDLQQQEIDQIRFEKQYLQEETRRLREMTQRNQISEAQRARQNDARGPPPLPRIHATYETSRDAPNIDGARDPVIFAGASDPLRSSNAALFAGRS